MKKLILLTLIISLALAQRPEGGRVRGENPSRPLGAADVHGPSQWGSGGSASSSGRSGAATTTSSASASSGGRAGASTTSWTNSNASSGPLGETTFPFFDELMKKANSIAADFANNPCVNDIVTQLQTDIVFCVLEWNKDRSLLDALSCAGKAGSSAQEKLLNKCNIAWDDN